MHSTYFQCKNLTGSPVCGNNVTNMYGTYSGCRNLTGSPVCGDNVTDMGHTYFYCYNLTGSPVCGNNVTSMWNTYAGCRNLNEGTFYFYSNKVSQAQNCFYYKNNLRRYNIHVPAGSKTLQTFFINNTQSIVGVPITWTNEGNNFYNTAYNIYIYANTSMQ